MKTVVALLIALGLTGSLVAQTYPAPKTAPAPTTGVKAAPKTDPKAAKKEEPPAKVEGQEVARSGGGFLGVQIVNGTFKISFYDAKKKLTAPNVVRAALRWDPKYKVGQERVVLNPSGPNALASEKTIRPPYHFKLFILLLKDAVEGVETAGESYVIDFRQ